MVRRIAVCHPRLGRGGSEAVTAWILEALRVDHRVTLLTLGSADFAELDRLFGTQLASANIPVRRPRGGRALSRLKRGDALRGVWVQRFARSVADDFDLLISAYNPMDFGRPGLHFIGDFSWSAAIRHELHGTGEVEPRGWRRRAYASALKQVGRPHDGTTFHAEDVVVANSGFTADFLRRRLGVVAHAVVYPPVGGPRGGLPAGQRSPCFLSLGRVAPEKRIEDQIAILRAVRSRGHDVTLEICGGPTEGAYATSVRSLVRENASWVSWIGWVSGEEKWRRLRAARFGIHTCRGEAFGISVAEMARVGCIPFVPRFGGAAEVVGDERLTFDGHDEAVARILQVLEEASLQQELSEGLQVRGELFGAERFVHEVRALVAAVQDLA